MAAGDEFDFEGEGRLPGGSFWSFLLSDHVVNEDGDWKNRAPPFGCSYSPSPVSLFSLDTPKMLYFGDYSNEDEMGSSLITSQSVSSSPVSKSSRSASINSPPKTSNCNKRRNGSSEKEASGKVSRAGAGVPVAGEDSGTKKSRPAPLSNGSRSAAGYAKVKVKKREKLGERIAALQQLVSPYGKTDTASVLHETMGYISFLQDQVKVLCFPYLQHTSNGDHEDRKCTHGLTSKGLCLVPADGISDIAASIGADFWSHVTRGGTTGGQGGPSPPRPPATPLPRHPPGAPSPPRQPSAPSCSRAPKAPDSLI